MNQTEPAEQALRSEGLSGRSERAADTLDLAAGVIAVSLFTLVSLNVTGVPRILLAVSYSVFVPGRAIVTNWRAMWRWADVPMSMIFSITVVILVTTITLWMGYWHPVGLFQIGAVLSTAGLGIGVFRRHRLRERWPATSSR